MDDKVGIVAVARPVVDWAEFLPNAERALGRSVTATMDHAGVLPDGPATFACAAAEFAQAGSHPLQVMRENAQVLKHLCYTFLLAAPRRLYLDLAGLDVSVTAYGDFAIATGSVCAWRAVTAMFLHSSRVADKPGRVLAVQLAAYFEREDYGLSWSCFAKEYTEDGLYTLTPRA